METDTTIQARLNACNLATNERRRDDLNESFRTARKRLLTAALPILLVQSGAALAQQAPTASISEMASTPLVRVNITEALRTPPDEASITVGTQAKAATATAAVAAAARTTRNRVMPR